MIPISSKKPFSALEILQYTLLISALLYFGKTLFIPLSFSMLISFILYPVCKWLEKKGIPQTIAIFISIFGVTLFLGTVIYLLFTQVIAFSNEWYVFKVKILGTANQLSFFLAERFDLSSEKQMNFLKNIVSNSGTQAISLLKTTLYSLSESVFYLVIIPVYSILILY